MGLANTPWTLHDQLTLDWHPIDISLEGRLISINAYGLVDTRPTIDQLLIKCGLRVELRGVPVECRSRCQSRVSIDTRLGMSFVHMIQDGYKTVYLPGWSRSECFWFPLSTQSWPLVPIQYFRHVSSIVHYKFMFVHCLSKFTQCRILVFKIHCKLRLSLIDKMRWDEMRWDEMRWDEMKSGQVRWDDRWGVLHY